MSPVFPSSAVAEHLFSVESDHGQSADRSQRTHELLARAQAADAAEMARLHEEVVLLNIEVAESIVMRYRNRGVPVEDLVQVACVGLVKAVRGFDPDKQ